MPPGRRARMRLEGGSHGVHCEGAGRRRCSWDAEGAGEAEKNLNTVLVQSSGSSSAVSAPSASLRQSTTCLPAGPEGRKMVAPAPQGGVSDWLGNETSPARGDRGLRIRTPLPPLAGACRYVYRSHPALTGGVRRRRIGPVGPDAYASFLRRLTYPPRPARAMPSAHIVAGSGIWPPPLPAGVPIRPVPWPAFSSNW